MPRRLLLLLGVLLAGGLALLFRVLPGEPPPVVGPGATTRDPAVEPGIAPPDRTRTPVHGNAPAIGRSVRVLDPAGAPLAGAALLDARDGALLATTGPDGRAALGDRAPHEIVFAARDHLLALFELGSPALAAAERVLADGGEWEVRLRRDDWTIPFPLRFVDPAGAPARGLRVRLLPAAVPPPSAFAFPGPPDAPAGERAAWQLHAQLALLPRYAPERWHLGLESARREFTGDGELALRFAAAGPYDLDATAEGGLAARQQIYVQRGRSEPLTVRLAPGAMLHGAVTLPDGTPLGGAELVPRAAFAAPVRSDEQGRFQLGPLPPGAIRLLVQHPDCIEQEAGPFTPGEPARILLVPRPEQSVRGRVRLRPKLAPVAGATITWEAGAHRQQAQSGADGAFELRTRAHGGTLTIESADCLRWVELITPGGPPLEFDLWPATARARVAAGLSALLAGRVVGPDGQPRPGTPVQLASSGTAPPAGFVPDRSIVEGAVVPAPLFVVADGDGRFEIECAWAGAVRLVAADGSQQLADGIRVEAVPGRVTGDLLLRTLR